MLYAHSLSLSLSLSRAHVHTHADCANRARSAPQPGRLPGWHYCRGYAIVGVGRWQSRALWVCAFLWAIGAQAVTLHIFTEAQYDACDGICSDAAACAAQAAPGRGSVAYDFGLYCENEWRAVMLGILYFLPGWFFGASVMGSVSDKYGRRPAMIASIVIGIASSATASLAPDFYAYAAGRTGMGFAFGGTGVVSYVLGCELMPTEWLSIIGVGFYNVYFVAGEAGIVAAALAIKDWRLLTGVVGAQAALALPLAYFFAPESPKWLISQGRDGEAKRAMLKAAALDGVAAEAACGEVAVYGNAAADAVLDAAESAGASGGARSSSLSSSDPASAPGKVGEPVAGGLVGLFRRPAMALMTVCITYAWLTVGGVYYGINFIAGDLPGSLYQNAVVSALVELPGTLLGNVMVDVPSLGRKTTTVLLYAITAGSCVCAAFMGGMLRTVVAYVGKLAISSAFCAVYVYSTEIFHTPSRNAGLGLASQMARVGSGAATGLVTALAVPTSMLMFAAFSGVAALAVQLCLVETLGHPLPEAVDEVLGRRKRRGAAAGAREESALLRGGGAMSDGADEDALAYEHEG